MRKGRLGSDRTQRILLGASITAALIATMAGGVRAQAPATSTSPLHRLDSTNWSLTTMSGGDTAIPGIVDAGVTLEFVGDQAGGTVGCDRYLVPLVVDGDVLTFGDVETTRTPCDEPTAALATAYLATLSSVASFSEADGTLSLRDAAGETVLALESAPMPSVDGSWNVTGFHDGSSMVTPSPGSVPALVFKPGGRLDGDGGCNHFGGTFGVSDSDIAIGPLMSTIRWCDDTLDAQETRLLEALQQAYTWTVTSGSLELRSSEDLSVVTADPASTDGSPVR